LKSIIFALFFSLLTFHAQSAPKSKDHKKLDQLFQVAEIYGARLVKCGRESEQKEMFSAIDFLEQAYSKLDRNFPTFTPRLVEQLYPRFEAICRSIDCRIIDKSHSSLACRDIGANGKSKELEQFEEAVSEAQKRLSKIKGGASINASGESCPNSAQYYQDAYVTNHRASDLECFRKVLERQQRRY